MQTLNSKRWLPPMAIKFLAGILICLAISASALAVGDGKARQRANEALRNGDYEAAEKQFRELLEKDAHDKDARLGLSFALLKQRLLQDAYDHAARVILTDPLSSRAHALLGSVILASGNFQNSVEEFRTSLSIQENEALAIAGLAMVDFYETASIRRSGDCAAPLAWIPTNLTTFSTWDRPRLATNDTKRQQMPTKNS